MLKDFLDRFGLGEVFAHILPGFVVLLSTLVWWSVDDESLLFESSLAAIAILLLVSYTIGLVIASYLTIAEGRYLLARHQYRKQRWLRRIPTGLILLACRYASPKPDIILTDWVTGIAATLRDLGAPIGLTQHIKTSERLGVFQAIARGRGLDDIIEEAQGYRRRAMYAMGVGIALALAAAQMLGRVVAEIVVTPVPTSWPDINGGILWAGAAVSAWTSLELRRVGLRMYAMEAYVSAFIAGEISRQLHQRSAESKAGVAEATSAAGEQA